MKLVMFRKSHLFGFLYETHTRKACSRLFNWQWRSTIGLCIFPVLSNCAVIAATSGLIVTSVISLYYSLKPFRYSLCTSFGLSISLPSKLLLLLCVPQINQNLKLRRWGQAEPINYSSLKFEVFQANNW